MSDTDGPRDADKAASNHDSESSNVADDEEEQVPPDDEELESKPRMSVYRKRDVIFFIFGLTFSTLAALYTSPKRISKTPTAKPFFNQSSIILDFYKGHLGAMVDRVTTSDFSFIMFYAPWDAECQAAREEFEIVAKYYHTQIFFAAINCWHPGSDCRTHYNKIQSYPVFMMYPPRDSGVQYRGILSAPYMIRFLSNFLNPIERIISEEDFTKLLTKHDSIMMGFFNFNGLRESPGYTEFYKTAIRHLERDPNRDTAFAVLTSATVSKIYSKINETFVYPSAALLSTNGTTKYPQNKEWTTENLINWLSKVRQKPVVWLQPPGVKSMTMANFLLSGPVLFLFTPRNILLSNNYNYDLLNLIGLEYHNCDRNPVRSNIISDLSVKVAQAESFHRNQTEFCSQLLLSSKSFQETPSISANLQHWINDSCCSQVVMNKCPVCEKVDTDSSQVCTVDSKNLREVCKGSDILYAPMNLKEQEKYEHCCSRHFEARQKEEERSKFEEKVDPLASESIKLHHIKENCRRILAGNEFWTPKFPNKESDTDATLSNSRCFSNKTLWFVAIDSVAYFHFADVFGMNVMKRPDKTAVVIVDSDQESQYIMQKPLTRNNLISFINNFVGGWLKRNLRCESSKSSYGRKVRKCETGDDDRGHVCVAELTTKTFLPAILDPDKDVIVFYHTPYCAFCSAVGYVFLTVAHYLRHMDHVRFVRIDGDNNDLPWEYTMNRYPSILFFPAKRKEDSTVFPFNLPITISNLVNFVLANLEGDSHVEALINICHAGTGESPRNCVRRIRRLCLDVIQDYLRAHRKLHRLRHLDRHSVARKRRRLLLQLEHARDVHLLLGSVENLQESKRPLTALRVKFRDYYASLRLVGQSVKKAKSEKRPLANVL